jgi:VWFA-related protein
MKPLTLALALFAGALSLLAQETVTVHVVEVPVTVIDRQGNPVRGLKPGNFELFDDGKRQTITAFDAIDFASTASVSAISPVNPNARRSFLLLFDLGYSDVKSIQRARAAAKQFLNANVQPRDLVSVGAIDPEKGFQLLTAFTTDRNMVAAAIAKPQQYRGTDPLQLSDLDSFGNPVGGAIAPPDSGSSGGATGNAALADADRADLQAITNRMNRDYATAKVVNQIQSLGILASTLRSVPGRKQVVLLSGGFDPALVRGRSARGAMRAEMADMQKATSGQAYNIDNDARFGSTQTLNVLDEMNKLFKQSDVVLNAIDIAGILPEGDLSNPGKRSQSVSNDGLHLLADATGGTVFENTNDIHANFDRMMREQEVVYVLAFQAQAEKPGKLHNLTVKTVDVPAAKVHNRPAYYEAGAGDTPAQRVLSNAEIIMNDLPQHDIRVESLAAAVPAASRAAVSLFLEINGQDLLHGSTKAVPADIFVYAFDEQGIVRDRLYQRINVDPEKASSSVKQSGIKYFATMAVPPGRYAIKALVTMPGTERRGFSRTDLLVPYQNDMAVMPLLFFDKPGQWAMLKGVQRDAAPYPFQLNGEPFVPSADPTLHGTEEREFALFLYNANADEMMMQATVTDSAGKTHPADPALARQLQGEGVTKLVFQYKPVGLPAGPATLDLTLHKKGSTDIHRASIPLVVE